MRVLKVPNLIVNPAAKVVTFENFNHLFGLAKMKDFLSGLKTIMIDKIFSNIIYFRTNYLDEIILDRLRTIFDNPYDAVFASGAYNDHKE